ncbi:AMIN domain-containing protein [Sulfurimonas sp. MAG313]|nr:AMIN domain-containing protein [Sulfurimonas sp. MAG313]MDF1881496.1 AMIN domain-containing protein [Sulfurimonas sp. MAG313]
MRFTLFIFLSFITLWARDNPFFPSDPNAQDMITSNHVENLKPFSQQEIKLPNSARAIKAITISYQNLDGSIEKENLYLNNKIDWHVPFVISHNVSMLAASQSKKKSKTINAKFIKFVPNKKSMRVITKDKMLRNFMLTSPHRIVLDFARETSFRPKNFIINEAPFKKIRMGKHDSYYRVVIELDGQYKYKLLSSEQDIKIVCF